MAETIKPSDKVRLKSGGPTMMVIAVSENGMMGGGSAHAYVTWFNNKKKPKMASYPLSIIEVVA